MKFEETLYWCIEHSSYDSSQAGLTYDEIHQCDREFMESLGLKPDATYFTTLNLNSTDAEDIICKMEDFCKTTGRKLRGSYSSCVTDIDSDWYRLYTPFIPTDAADWYETIPSNHNMPMRMWSLKAYKAKGLHFGEFIQGFRFLASDKFRKVCIESNIPGVEFCYLEDKGKFDSQQYFQMFFNQLVNPITSVGKLQYEEKYDGADIHGKGSLIYEKLNSLGGFLPRLNEIFSVFTISPEIYLPTTSMPAGGFAYIATKRFASSLDEFCDGMLYVHKDTAEILLREKLIQKKLLRPAIVSDIIPPGYERLVTIPMGKPTKEYFEKMQLKYEEFIKKPRPKRKASDKEALSRMRKAKTESKEDFGKRMKKEIAESLMGTAYEKLIPYYLVADGGYLSDEYRLLPYSETMQETKVFVNHMKIEDLAPADYEGIIIAKCADSDAVLLHSDGRVLRFGFMSPEIVTEWINMAEFVTEAIEAD